VVRLSYKCLEAGCEFDCEADSEAGLVEIVQRHMGDTHDTFELEDVILAGAAPVDGSDQSGG
jgi:predicted small metal-binding protein